MSRSWKKRKKHDAYYKRQKELCKMLGIRTPPKKLSLIRKFIFLYKEIERTMR